MCLDFVLVFTLGDPSHVTSVVLLALVKNLTRTVLLNDKSFYKNSP